MMGKLHHTERFPFSPLVTTFKPCMIPNKRNVEKGVTRHYILLKSSLLATVSTYINSYKKNRLLFIIPMSKLQQCTSMEVGTQDLKYCNLDVLDLCQ